MKAKQSVLKRNLHKIFYLFIGMSLVLCSFKSSSLNGSVQKNQGMTNLISWVSNNINRGNGYNFAKADANRPALKNCNSHGFTSVDSTSITSNYDYKVTLSVTNNDPSAAVIAFDDPVKQVDLSDLMSNIPAELLAGMEPSQVRALSDLTSAMSAAQVVSKLKEDKLFRQEVQNAGGSMISKDLYVLAHNYN